MIAGIYHEEMCLKDSLFFKFFFFLKNDFISFSSFIFFLQLYSFNMFL